MVEIVATSLRSRVAYRGAASYLILSSPGSLRVLAEPSLTGEDLVHSLQSAASIVDTEVVRPRARDRVVYLCPMRGGVAYLPDRVDEDLVDYFVPGATVPAAEPGAALEVLGDTVALGAVLEGTIRHQLGGRRSHEPWRLIVHGFLAEPGVARLVALLNACPPEQRPTELVVVAYEALFRLPTEVSDRYGAQDFLRGGIPCSRPYRDLLSRSPELCLEKCAVYDTGDRAFSPEAHVAARAAHWEALSAMDDDALASECNRRSGLSFLDDELRACLAGVA
jgi:hypothetical protein